MQKHEVQTRRQMSNTGHGTEYTECRTQDTGHSTEEQDPLSVHVDEWYGT